MEKVFRALGESVPRERTGAAYLRRTKAIGAVWGTWDVRCQ